ncbi:carbon-nitrogen hydrolase family protein [Bacillus sp. 1P10SD]|uniref:carbon-nitrogen hydrolase family protein n=1 Tax=Bacillus sp. 1P10SD TaxID=3132265 RepID=UPI0039A4D08D
MRIGLAQTRFSTKASDGLQKVEKMLVKANKKQCDLVCFPESIIPGLRGVGYEIEEYDHNVQQEALNKVCRIAKGLGIHVILPMEWKDNENMHLLAFVINKNGEIVGYQTKNQMDPEEDFFGYAPGKGRTLFEAEGVKFGIVICHEGWRYPETVRWAARKDASIVFHPQFTGDVKNPEFYNQAMVCRSMENSIFFASVNYALENQKSTTSLISPFGERLLCAKSNEEELLIYDINPEEASLHLAKRFNPDLF